MGTLERGGWLARVTVANSNHDSQNHRAYHQARIKNHPEAVHGDWKIIDPPAVRLIVQPLALFVEPRAD